MTAVLFTCAGQRVDIVSAFGRAGAVTVAVDVDPLAPALYHAHRHTLVPRVNDPGYLPRLRELVAEHDVALVVPLTDLDQELLAERRETLRTPVLLSPAPVVEAMADKYRAAAFLAERGIASPPTWLPAELPADPPFPLLVKARAGFGSRHIYRAHDRAELDFFLRYTPVDSMVQACCRGEEFSIDVLSDFEGRCLNAIPRTMIQSKGGESIKGMTIKDWELIDFARTVAEALPIWGPANVQCFREPGGGLEVTDVNPRFGGGFPLPLAAGSRYPELALALATGARPEPAVGDFREGVVMTRFFSDLCLLRDGDGALVPFAEELPRALAAKPGEA
ncbi:MAG: ATP-grasp domain-containing protein [Thermoleophilia bacterium]|nr:ATP-grasp domain-containing protein [Thermoleophilia bacterium]